MAHPAGPRTVKVAVLLAPDPQDLGEWLADGASFEAAGADAVWVGVEPDPVLDPLALTAALAAVTFRSMVVTPLPAFDGPPSAMARTLTTIGRLSRGRLRILTDAGTGAAAAALGPDLGVFRRVPDDAGAFEHPHGSDGVERWVVAAAPDGRAAWRAALLDAAERGVAGLVVPAGPRLLDILRNPDDPDLRRDLQLAQG